MKGLRENGRVVSSLAFSIPLQPYRHLSSEPSWRAKGCKKFITDEVVCSLLYSLYRGPFRRRRPQGI